MLDLKSIREDNLFEFKTFHSKIIATEQAWHDFMDHGIPPSEDVIKPYVFISWQRSLKAGLNPYQAVATHISPEDFTLRLAANSELIQAATPMFDSFADQLHDKVFALDLYDKDLCFIKTYGQKKGELINARRGYGTPGLRRDEAACGTTAMSIAKEIGKAVRVTGAEHFDINLHNRICTSVPIFSPEGDFLGLITLVEQFPTDEARTLATMIALGKGVEYNLSQIRSHNDLQITNSFNEAILESISDAIIVVDSDYYICMANQAAMALINPYDRVLVGKQVNEFFGANNAFSQVLQSQKPIFDKEIVLTIDETPRRFMGTVKTIYSDRSTINGVIATLRDMVRTRKMLKTISGWNASLTFNNIIGQNPLLLQTIQLAKQTAILNSNILIQGESGTGKEIFAQAIHNASNFCRGPFVAVNCAAIPVSLLESELFGYESGAFTGANKNGQPGKFELAEGGTIFLDEINSMTLDIQAKLLRVVQDKKVTRVGSTDNINLHLRIIAACNVNLWDMVSQGNFRSDLFYRLNVITIWIPPLRDRVDDIPLLVKSILNRIQGNSDGTFSLSNGALMLLQKYHWPGNVRELENILERGSVQAIINGRNVIDINDFASLSGFSQINQNNGLNLFETGLAEEFPLKSSEYNTIQRVLTSKGGNISKAAKALGISRTTLYRKMKEHNITL